MKRTYRTHAERKQNRGAILQVLTNASALQPPGWITVDVLVLMSGLPASTLGVYLGILQREGLVIVRQVNQDKFYRLAVPADKA